MPNSDQLTFVVTAFELWRSNRKGRQAPTPISLRKQAVSLLNTYSTSQIISALRISGGQLKQWRHSFDMSEPLCQFIELPISSTPSHAPMKLELHFVSSDQLRLTGVADLDVLTTLIGAMKS
tara:strand:- start:556 stop:921 length:366 start_codon:yes stop_codon:yes gene_type:complete